MRGGTIVGPVYDAVMFWGAPLLALGLGAAISGTSLADDEVVVWGRAGTLSGFFIGSFVMAHLVLVLVRSHLNPTIFARHPGRFVAAPIATFALLFASDWALAVSVVVVVWWDVVHSAMQTFGLARIYDARGGNPSELGRRLDLGLGLLLYIGPLLAGATLLQHLACLEVFEGLGVEFFRVVPAHAEAHQGALAWGLAVVGALYLVVYVAAYRRLARRGYRVSALKVALLVSTSLCSIYAWGFNSFGEAFFIMNFFHAWQYFGLVWATEGRGLQRRVGLERVRWGRGATLALMLAVTGAYGVWAEWIDADQQRLALCVTLVVSLMHFWYDGFVWSVRRRDV